MKSRSRILVSVLIIPVFMVIILIINGNVNTVPKDQPSVIPQTTSPPSVEPTETETKDPYFTLRENMVSYQIEARGVTHKDVLMAMRKVPRQEFVLESYIKMAYADSALPINYGQTISQPYIVALMTELLNVKSGDRVLEIGTGSGYQAAVLAEIGVEVYSIEIIPQLAQEAADRLQRLGYSQVNLLNEDGYFGWNEYAPYDAIIVTAAPDHLPNPLISQLKEGGRLVIPIGPIGAVQTLWLFQKIGGEIQAENKGSVTFVPLTGEH